MNSSVAVALISAFVAAASVMFVARIVWNRAQRSQVRQAKMRLGIENGGEGESARFDGLLALLERAVRDLRVEALETEAHSSRLQSSLDALPIAVMVFDGDGNVIESNTASLPFLEARHGDALVGAAVNELIQVSNAGSEASTVIELFGPPKRTVEVSTVPLLEGGQTGSIAFVEDVTERKQLEAIRIDLVANISHELKTPVGAIGLLAETLQGEDDQVIVERLASRINAEAIRIAQIIEDLIELSRIETVDGVGTEEVDLGELAQEAIERLLPAARQAGVAVLIDRAQDRNCIVGERRQLLSAIGNLIDNGIKYSDAGTTVEVSVCDLAGEVIVRVTDHGIGIPTRDIDRIFERFYRVDQARSRQTGGTGLGLAIVRHAVVNHGAQVEVESRLGVGSTFTLRFPTSRHESFSSAATGVVTPERLEND